MNNDIPWLDRPEIVNVSDWLTNDQFTWLFDGVLIKDSGDVKETLRSLFQADMVETTEDDGSLWTVYVYEIPKSAVDLPEFKYLRGSHRGKTGYTLTSSHIYPGDVIVCHRLSSYNPGPVRPFAKMFTKADRALTFVKSD